MTNGICYSVVHRAEKDVLPFQTQEDYLEYLKILRRHKPEFKIRIFGFCLLPRTVYLILQPRKEGLLAGFMQAVAESYKRYLNGQNQYVDRAWQGKFETAPIHTDEELFDTIRFIESMPVMNSLSTSPATYLWSSCSYRVVGTRNRLVDQKSYQ